MIKLNKAAKMDYCLFWVAKKMAKSPAKNLSLSILSVLKAKGAFIQGVDLIRAKIRIAQGRTSEALEMVKEELRLFPANQAAAKLLHDLGRDFPPKWKSMSKELQELMPILSAYTMLSPERLEALLEGAKRVCRDDIPGNFVECGVAGGGSSALLAWAIKKYSKRPRTLFSFDTFRGMPEPGKQDTHKGLPAKITAWGQGTCAAPVESLFEVLEKLRVKDLVKAVPGLFQETLPLCKEEVGELGLLHLDGDWYDSTKAILENLYGMASARAYLQVDDYGHWDGCKKAVDEFFSRRKEELQIHPIDATGVWFKKN
jgi:hypothetical protein